MTSQIPESAPVSDPSLLPPLDPTPGPTSTAGVSELHPHFLPSQSPESPEPPLASVTPDSPTDPSTSPELPSPGPDAGSSSAAPSGKTTGKPSKTELAPFVQEAVGVLSGVVHSVLTHADSLPRQEKVWLADAEDLIKIGDPLTAIVSRKLPEGIADAGNADVGRLVLAVGGYVIKNLRKLRNLKGVAAAGVVPEQQPQVQ